MSLDQSSLTVSERSRYARQVVLPGFGAQAQEKLKRSRVLIVGAGGLGSPVALYLAAAGVGTIGLVDSDVVDESNLQRQILFSSYSLGKLKTKEAGDRLRALNPHVHLEEFPFALRAANAEAIIKNFDLVVDGSDNFSTRYLVNDVCVVLDKPFISASVLHFQGQLSVFNARLDEEGRRGPTYRCLFPEPPRNTPNCAEAGVIGALVGVLGSLQALEAIKVLTGIGTPLHGKLLCLNGLDGEFLSVTFERDEALAQQTRILDDDAYSVFCGVQTMAAIKQISVQELKNKIDAGEHVPLIDVREPSEREICSLGGELIPLGQLEQHLDKIPRDRTVVVYCRSGGRSGKAVAELQGKHGFTNLLNLQGGVLAWADQIDPSMTKY